MAESPTTSLELLYQGLGDALRTIPGLRVVDTRSDSAAVPYAVVDAASLQVATGHVSFCLAVAVVPVLLMLGRPADRLWRTNAARLVPLVWAALETVHRGAVQSAEPTDDGGYGFIVRVPIPRM